MVTAQPHTLEPVTEHTLKTACMAANNSAAGLDNFAPDDSNYLSDLTIDWLAYLLNTIEEGADLPKDLQRAKAA